jgi:xanthine dehydrogenase YagR molybdenum-binding subunit
MTNPADVSSAAVIGRPINRVDGVAKVTGHATYAAEYRLERVCHAVLIPSSIAAGIVTSIDTRAAQAQPGVLLVMTPFSAMRLPNGGNTEVSPPAGRALTLLQDNKVHYNGQPVAAVVAETLEQAQGAARLLVISYQQAEATLDFDVARSTAHTPKAQQGRQVDTSRGDFAAGLAQASVSIDQVYHTPLEFHNPMEPHATIAEWSGERLTLHDSTQGIIGLKKAAAKVFGIDPGLVHTVCQFVGGGFGSKGSMWSHVMIAAMAAKMVGRPVKLVVERSQMFFPVGFRPITQQRLQLGADRGGQLVAVRHDTVSSTSKIEDWSETCGIVTRMLYACPNLDTTHKLSPMNIGTPTFTRAPGEASGSFALECAMDELAIAQGIDPLELRLANYTEVDPGENKPFSQKSLRECYQQGAARFDWARRVAKPRSMRLGHHLVGLGMATATYPANRQKCEAMARLNSDGSVVVQSASQDLGTGTYTVMTQVAAQTLGFPLRQVHFDLGDSAFPEASGSGGSTTAASLGPAVLAACQALRQKIIDTAVADPQSVLYRVASADVEISDGWLMHRQDTQRRDAASAVIGRRRGQPLEAEASAESGTEKQQYSSHSFGAVFAEVHVDELLGTIVVERITAAYNVGTLMNEKTARSQLMGGLVWGISMALLEKGDLDARYGRIVNNNLAEYHVPVNADIRSLDIIVVPSSDTIFNPLGARGIGEIGITGVAAAIANAVYNATGERVRSLPITLDTLV